MASTARTRSSTICTGRTAIASPGRPHGWAAPVAAADRPLAKRHYRTGELAGHTGPQIDARVALLFNDDLIAGVASPSADDPVYIADGDADQLIYVHRGGGVLRSLLGDVGFAQGDYVFVPRGLLHRFLPVGPQQWFWFSLTGGVHVPNQWRNAVGQLRMDAPYSHRDFKRPALQPPRDEGIRDLVVRRGGSWHGFSLEHSPLDAVGWDGTVYPWAFPILAFQPRVQLGPFAADVARHVRGPRCADLQLRAQAARLPPRSDSRAPIRTARLTATRSSSTATASSRRVAVSPRQHLASPDGRSARPAPGELRASIGATRTDELAVMADTFAVLRATPAALSSRTRATRTRSASPVSATRRLASAERCASVRAAARRRARARSHRMVRARPA